MSLYVDESRPEVETLIAEASLPQHIRSDLRLRQDESGNLILRVRDGDGFGAWRDARLSDLAPPQFDAGEAKRRAYRGSWQAGTNYKSRLIAEYSSGNRKTVSAYDRPKYSHLMEPMRANFLITSALPTLTDAPLLDLMELPADDMERVQAIFVRNHRIRQGQIL
jgi:hypothetical protein